MKIKSRVQLRKSVKNKLLASLVSSYGDVIDRIADKKLESAIANWFKVIIVDDDVLFFQAEEGDEMFPTVKGVLEFGIDHPKVVVDAGAVRFVVNGADIMGPGIVAADPDIMEGDLVVVAEVTHNKPLAIGRALVPASDMVGKSGKAIKSIHYVGDELWNLEA